MEKTLKNAIAHAKRNIDKYSANENILNTIYEYYLRSDEIQTLVNSFNAFATKHHRENADYDTIIRCM